MTEETTVESTVLKLLAAEKLLAASAVDYPPDLLVETAALKLLAADLGDFVENLDAVATLLEKMQSTPGKHDPRWVGIDKIVREQAGAFLQLVAGIEQLPDHADPEVVRAALTEPFEGYEYRSVDPIERQIALAEKIRAALNGLGGLS